MNTTDDGTDDKFSGDVACHPSLTSGPRTLASIDDEIGTGMYRNTLFYHEIYLPNQLIKPNSFGATHYLIRLSVFILSKSFDVWEVTFRF